MQTVIIHYNEISLKGRNRAFFEQKLEKDIRSKILRDLPNISELQVTRLWGYLHIRMGDLTPKQQETLRSSLLSVFGIANFSFVVETNQNISDIARAAINLMKKYTAKSFKIHTRRTQKTFPQNSQEINERVGQKIVDNLNLRVDLSRPDTTCYITIADNTAYLYTEKIPGLGGLPQETSGNTIALLSGGYDSPVAAYQIMRKGATIHLLHFHSVPYTSVESINKAKKLARVLGRYQSNITLTTIPLTDIQRAITLACPEKLRIVIFRRCMLRLAEMFAQEKQAKALVTGDSLGQVASQTLSNIVAIEEATHMPLFRPLIGMDKEEIMQRAKAIGTHQISSEPHEDCCSMFVPKQPETKASLDKVREAERLLPLSKLLDEAIAQRKEEKL